MILKILKGMSPKAKIWDNTKQKILFAFKDGEFNTDDEYIIKFWGTRDSSVCTTKDIGVGEKPTKRKRRTKAEMSGEA